MAVISKFSPTSITVDPARKKSSSNGIGSNVVDIDSYNDDVHKYLLGRGAEEFTGWTSSYRPLSVPQHFIPTAFPGCKPTHFGATIRLFFPTEDDALLFSLAFGHLITGSYVKPIQKLIEENRD